MIIMVAVLSLLVFLPSPLVYGRIMGIIAITIIINIIIIIIIMIIMIMSALLHLD